MSSRLLIRADQLQRAHPGLRLDKFMDIEEPDWKETKVDNFRRLQAFGACLHLMEAASH